VRRSAVQLLLVLVATFAAVAAGCGSDAEPPTTQSAAPGPVPAPGAGAALARFVEAAGAGDVDSMWSLLSLPSRQRLGPTEGEFGERYAREFQGGLGSFAGTDYELVLAVELPSGWGVAAIAGDRVRAGEREFASYAAALRQEGSAWRIELGAPVSLRKLRPEQVAVTDARPVIEMEIEADSDIEEAGLWLDGRSLAGRVTGSGGRVAVSARPSAALAVGRHVIVVFGRSGDLAAAGSAPLRVPEAPAGTTETTVAA
jgi:hypothetical protein